MDKRLVAYCLMLFLASTYSIQDVVGENLGAIEDWPMFQQNSAHTGATNSSGPTSAPTVLWSKESMGIAPNGLAVADGIVYASTNDLFAYNASTGQAIWNVTNGGKSSPVVTDGIVYTGAYCGTAYNATTGVVIWSIGSQDSYDDVVAVYDGIFYSILYAHNEYEEAQARNATTGEIIWTSESVYFYRVPAFSDGYFYYTSFNGSAVLNAVNAYDGKRIWQTVVSIWENENTPSVSSGYVYVGSDDSNLYCFDAYTGERIWNYSTRGPVRSTPAVANGIVYFGSADFYVYAVNASTGEEIWRFKTVTWRYNEGTINPVVANETVYVGTLNGEMYALDAHDGRELWNYKVESEYDNQGAPRRLALAPAIAYGNIYLRTMDHFIIVLATTSPKALSNQDIAIIAVAALAAIVPLTAWLIRRRHENKRYYAEA